MTRTMFRRILALLVAVCAALSLAACGGQTEEAKPVEEYRYKSSFAEVSGGASGALNVMAYSGDTAYASCSEKIGREIPASVDTENLTEEELEAFDLYTTNIYKINSSGTAEKLPDYEPVEGVENEGNKKDFYSQSNLESIAVDGEGNLVITEQMYTGWYDGPEGLTYLDDNYYDYFVSSQESYVRTLNQTGAEITRAKLELTPDKYFRAFPMTDSDGNILGSSESELCAFNKEGQLAYSVDCGGYVESAVTLADGKLYVNIWGEDGLSIAPVDSINHSLGKRIKLPDDAYSPIAGSGNYDIYYTSGSNFYGYDFETATADKLFNWINCDVDTNDLRKLRVTEDGVVYGIVSEQSLADNTYSNDYFTVEKVLYDPSEEVSTLTMACLSMSGTLQSSVIRFNRGSDSARIEIKDYSEFNTAEDSEAGTQKLLTEIMAGDVPDLILLDGLPQRRIASKGVLEDLYPYLDADKELQRDDILPNVLGALEVDGKLSCVSPSFYVVTVIGAVSVVGDKTSWTYDDFDAALATMPEGCDPFEAGVSRDDILRACLSLDMSRYVNWSTGQCSFDNDEFMSLLKFASRFPADHTDGSEESTQERIRTGQQMLIATSIYSLDDVIYDSSYFNGQPVRYIGFPTNSGSGNVITAEGCMAMTKSCADKDAAWAFLRGYFTADYQENNIYSIPTNREAYENKMAQLMRTTYLKDENGQYVLDENGEKIKEPRYTMSSDDGPVVNVYALTEEQAAEVSSVVYGSTKFYDYDQSIVSIVTEQAEAYFAGQKSAEEVAKLVQAKANIYVNEQR